MELNQEDLNFIQENTEGFVLPMADPDKHITTTMVAKRLGVTRMAAYNRLEKLVEEGKLKKEMIRNPNGRSGWGYYRD